MMLKSSVNVLNIVVNEITAVRYNETSPIDNTPSKYPFIIKK